ncbi:GvpL/GvpF family gas vesicle protein [Streptomyces sp. ITFR-6]|nr:GvpL/GvpF family gas vesicle protein [Streptomyces sp. ITFR-6]WNI27808.1 GvpL/GvpF family gas vesicle protein [Streptomyces sp. ITFR-6]
MSASTEGVYVYAIVPAATALPKDAAGVGSPPMALRVVRQGLLAAVVSDAPPRLRARRRDLLAHQNLLMRLAEASLRLGEAIAGALTRRAAAAGQRILRELAPVALASVPGQEVQGCVLNESFLVDRSESEAFLSRARSLGEAFREHAEIRPVGPLPCYSFVSAEARPALVGGS